MNNITQYFVESTNNQITENIDNNLLPLTFRGILKKK